MACTRIALVSGRIGLSSPPVVFLSGSELHARGGAFQGCTLDRIPSPCGTTPACFGSSAGGCNGSCGGACSGSASQYAYGKGGNTYDDPSFQSQVNCIGPCTNQPTCAADNSNGYCKCTGCINDPTTPCTSTNTDYTKCQ